MAELTVTTFATVDGVMQAPGGPKEDTSGDFRHGGWVFPHWDADLGSIMVDIFSKADAFLLGRSTYDTFAGHFPRVQDQQDPVASRLNTLPKHVASRTRTSFDWQGSSLVRDVTTEVAALKKRYSGELQVHGSAGLIQSLISADLVDEYRILTFPVVLGTGKRLFGKGAVPMTLALKHSQPTAGGVVYSIYGRSGALKTGSFALE